MFAFVLIRDFIFPRSEVVWRLENVNYVITLSLSDFLLFFFAVDEANNSSRLLQYVLALSLESERNDSMNLELQ
jgi:hypothetical protein